MTDAERIAMAQTYALVFQSEAGRRVLADLQRSYGDRRSFASDPYVTAFREGQRDVYLGILDMLEFAKNPSRYLHAVVETEAA